MEQKRHLAEKSHDSALSYQVLYGADILVWTKLADDAESDNVHPFISFCFQTCNIAESTLPPTILLGLRKQIPYFKR